VTAVCPPPEHLTFLQKLRHDFKNSYYQVVALYVAFVLTVIMVSVVFDLKAR
jgi:hypothetical protein